MKILFTLILWYFWIPFDKTGYKQNAESIRTSINIVICSKIILKFDEVTTTDFLPYLEFLIISDSKMISSPRPHSLSCLELMFNHFLTSKIL